MALNETLLNYQNIISVTQDPTMLIVMLIVWGFPLLIYLIIGIWRKARTTDGRIIKGTRMIQTVNYWIVFSIWFVIQSVLFITMLIYPFWAKLVN